VNKRPKKCFNKQWRIDRHFLCICCNAVIPGWLPVDVDWSVFNDLMFQDEYSMFPDSYALDGYILVYSVTSVKRWAVMASALHWGGRPAVVTWQSFVVARHNRCIGLVRSNVFRNRFLSNTVRWASSADVEDSWCCSTSFVVARPNYLVLFMQSFLCLFLFWSADNKPGNRDRIGDMWQHKHDMRN